MRTLHIVTAALVATIAQAASAALVLSDDFSEETPGLQVASLTNFSVTGGVDVVAASNPYGIVASKNVIDLDGTPGPGTITSNSFAFGAGSGITLTFVLGGAQRGSVSDEFQAGFAFTAPVVVNQYTFGGGYGTVNLGDFGSVSSVETSSLVVGTSPFTTYSLSFIAGTAGSVAVNIGSTSADNVGPLLSSVTLDIAPVPEPATWALFVGGFGLVGLAARRRGFASA